MSGPYTSTRIRINSETDSNLIRTGFRRLSDSVPVHFGQLAGAKRRCGSSGTVLGLASQGVAAIV